MIRLPWTDTSKVKLGRGESLSASPLWCSWFPPLFSPYGAGAWLKSSVQVSAVAGIWKMVLRGMTMRWLFIVRVPPENGSAGLSRVALWMNPVISKIVAAGSGSCARSGAGAHTPANASTSAIDHSRRIRTPPFPVVTIYLFLLVELPARNGTHTREAAPGKRSLVCEVTRIRVRGAVLHRPHGCVALARRCQRLSDSAGAHELRGGWRDSCYSAAICDRLERMIDAEFSA